MTRAKKKTTRNGRKCIGRICVNRFEASAEIYVDYTLCVCTATARRVR